MSAMAIGQSPSGDAVSRRHRGLPDEVERDGAEAEDSGEEARAGPARAPPGERMPAMNPPANVETRNRAEGTSCSTRIPAQFPTMMQSAPAAIPAQCRRSGVQPRAPSPDTCLEARRLGRTAAPTAPAAALTGTYMIMDAPAISANGRGEEHLRVGVPLDGEHGRQEDSGKDAGCAAEYGAGRRPDGGGEAGREPAGEEKERRGRPRR